jgi:hypothetical protein
MTGDSPPIKTLTAMLGVPGPKSEKRANDHEAAAAIHRLVGDMSEMG